MLPDGNIISVVAKLFWSVKMLFLPASLAKETADSMTLLSSANVVLLRATNMFPD